MKKLLTLFFAAFLVSCSTYSPLVNFIDYSKYNDQGVFLTESNSVSFEYEPVGSVNVLLYSGYHTPVPEVEKKNRQGDPVYSGSSMKKDYQDATIEKALALAVDQAKEQEGNAIINLQYEFVPSGKGTPSAWYVSGMVVNR